MRYFATILMATVLVIANSAMVLGPANAQSGLSSLFGGPFELIDHAGRRVTERSFAGRHMLIYFGYTYCPDVCPTDLTAIAAALDEIGPLAKRLQPLFITVDPARDTAEVMRGYVTAIHPALVGLTGTEAQVRAAAKAFRVHREVFRLEGAETDDYLVNHSSMAFLMGRDGKFVTLFPHGTAPEKMAMTLRKYLER